MRDPIEGSDVTGPRSMDMPWCGDHARFHGRGCEELAAASRSYKRDELARRVLAACVLVLACGAASAQSAVSCERRLLQELGWRFVVTTSASATIDDGAPCDRGSLAEAHAAGDLRVRVPANANADAVAALERAVLAHPATRCAHAFALGAATRRAVDRLVANRGFRFSTLQPG